MESTPGIKFFEALKSLKDHEIWATMKFKDEELKEILEDFNIPLTLAGRKPSHAGISEIGSVLATLSAIHYESYGNHIDYDMEDEELLEAIYVSVYGEPITI